MKKGFRIICLMVILTLFTSVIVSCSPKDVKDDENDDEIAAEEKIIQIFIPGYEDEIWKGLYDKGI